MDTVECYNLLNEAQRFISRFRHSYIGEQSQRFLRNLAASALKRMMKAAREPYGPKLNKEIAVAANLQDYCDKEQLYSLSQEHVGQALDTMAHGIDDVMRQL